MYLNVHSHYSLRYGTLSVERIVELAVQYGIGQLALTDINNSSAAMPFVKACRERGIEPILGIEFRTHDHRFLYTGIARNHEGFRELNDFLSQHNLEKIPLPTRAPHLANAYFIYGWENAPKQLNENELIGIRPQQVNKLWGQALQGVRDKMVIFAPVTINSRTEARLHHYLRAVSLNTLFTKVPADQLCGANEVMLPLPQLLKIYQDYPFLAVNTQRLMTGCSMNVELGTPKNKKVFTGNRAEDKELLHRLTAEGYQKRYGSNSLALERIKSELTVIEQMDFMANYLIVHDFVWAGKAQGFYHIGRGSAGNSIVAYCLSITDVEPVELDLYFERFLNNQRTSPPDFDIDFSWDDRPKMHEYVFKKYGAAHTALLGTFVSFKHRSVIREFGKVLGLADNEIASFTDPSQETANRQNPHYLKILQLMNFMGEVPNQRSIHAGGVLISEEPISYYTALDLPPVGLPTVQWDMYVAEEIGYEKFDILSQRGIGHLKTTVQVIEKNLGKKVDIHAVEQFKIDPKINANFKVGNTIGGFYTESPGMRSLLFKLCCSTYIGLVAASSLIRPGTSKSMPDYIARFHDPSKTTYLHPVMEELLKETYGIMVYQEDVLKVCIHYAGMSGSDADVLRRGMSGKWRSPQEMERVKGNFFNGANGLNRPNDVTLKVWELVAAFAGYSFSKAHSASFAVESYQSMYLKTYYPREFMVGVLNNYGGFYARWLYVFELQKAGAIVHLPCVNHSEAEVSIRGMDAWLGFTGILDLEKSYIEKIPLERYRNGPFKDLEDFVHRSCITLEQCKILIRAGALRFTGKNKKVLLWEVHKYIADTSASNQLKLFGVRKKNIVMPADLLQTEVEDAYDEIELLGFSLTLNMFDLLRTSHRGDVMAKDLKNYVGQTVRMVGNFVTDKPVHTVKNETMFFAAWLDDNGDWFDTVHFPQSFKYSPFKGRGCYLILGKVIEEFGFQSLEVIRCEILPVKDRKDKQSVNKAKAALLHYRGDEAMVA